MKYKYIFFVFILSVMINMEAMAQENPIGSWVLSSINEYDYSNNAYHYQNHQLYFTKSGISSSIQLDNGIITGPGSNDFAEFTGGAYMCTIEQDFYVMGKHYFFGDESGEWETNGSVTRLIHSDFQIIRSIDEDLDYKMFYSQEYGGGSANEHTLFHVVDVKIENGDINFTRTPLDLSSTGDYLEDSKGVGFIISNFDSDLGQKYLYVVVGDWTDNSIDSKFGLQKFIIDEDGIEHEETLLENLESDVFENSDFRGYNLEMQDKNEFEAPIFAWITTPNPGNNSKILIYNSEEDDEEYAIDLEVGAIGGIEFSPFENEKQFLYLSCEDEGIIKLNYTDGSYIVVSGTSNFGHTYLQTAPDGNIYAVADNGHNLGVINRNTGLFSANVFDYDPTTNNYFHNAFTEIGNIKYYTLPENDLQMLNTSISTSPDICDLESGSATICVSGGIPEYSLVAYYDDPEIAGYNWQDISNLFVFNSELDCFEASNLMWGNYRYKLTDQSECEDGIEEQFVILKGDMYDFSENMLEIGNDAPTEIYGLEDMIWDLNDNDPEEGFIIDGKILFKHGFILKDNKTLTINNLTMEFDQDFMAKVIIKPGSKLVLNNCILTNYECWDADAKWQGIEVWGNKGLSQTEANQGKLVLNNTTIEHANEAVQLWRPDYYSTSGGMISAINSNFLNNHRAVVFMDYKNMKFGLEWDYSSGFSQCTFENNSDYIMDNPFLAFVTMWQVRGVSFTACDFINTSAFPESKAIYTLDAGYKFKGKCTGVTGPNGECVSGWETNTFTKFEKAIESGNTVGSPDPYAITIEDSYFENNHYGIFMTTVENAATIINNEFEIGNNGIDNFEKQKCSYFSARGIQMNQSFGFDIEENTFSKMQGTTGGDVVGVLVYECPSESDDIYKNIFNGLTAGNQAELWNRLNHLVDEHGVTYLCNENTNNTIDIFIAENSMITGHVGSLQEAAGNKFSITNPQIQNNFTQEVNYYWVDEPYEELEYYSNYVTPIEVTNENECLSNFGSGGGTGLETKLILTDIEKLEVEQDFYSNYQDYEAVNILLEELKDGGSTETTSLSIASAQATDTWELRANLLGMSPYLSKEVLIEATDKTDVLPESVLFEILSANPDELRKTDLMEHLENKEQPLPDYMINVLKQMSTGVSAKTALIGQKTKSFVNKTKAAQTIIRSIKNEEELNIVELRNWLGNMGNIEADKQIVGTYLYEDNYTAANNLLNLIPNLYNLQGEKLQEFNDYKELLNLQVALKQQDRNVFMLNSTEKSQLIDLAENSNGEAKYGAQNILSFVYGDNYCDCISPINQNKASTSSFYYSQDDFAKAMGLSMDIKPNPATIYTSIDYTLPIGIEKAMLQLINVEGKTLHTENIDGVQGQITFDIRNHPNGTYLIKIQAGDYQLSETLIIQ
ncbi:MULTISPECIES: T9SS type A sorting domain-containing protein [unclassified Lentimicrobium]|uniref:T9SS type A sorting domain-containing protein n=1 Tax=unclassified Lentimicrobium TaxID=2677434 RepID=UPI00155717A4|nr:MULTISPECIES: T9SS type A sorting domain-containing protein [unclassified Lentimicrobium]NPD47628.1 T9SS type A sorting domain-containing protein [Lentimicrobium sp. S6]NPD84703.1 T9SS type A sorting domain-containing protein [Lentimicrobium sp. L6]